MAMIPQPVRTGVEDALAHLGVGGPIRDVVPVTGGCINHGARVDAGGEAFFLKWNAAAPPHFFEFEADGLRALGSVGALRVPRPLAHGGGSGAPAWFLMEYVEPGRQDRGYPERLGRGLADIHASGAKGADTFGWPHRNWIGSLRQSNTETRSWGDFWRDERLAPQLRQARNGGFGGSAGWKVLDRLLDLVPQALADVPPGTPHLLHGDLWGGNAFADAEGTPTLIDPAVYRGHGEVDLAMTELFGGFGPRFYDAYREAGHVSEAYRAYRRDLYQLYYLLVHVNLFGSQYESATLEAAARVAAALQA